MSSAISAKNLAIGYSSGNAAVTVSRIPSLELKKGKLTCLLGANGIGKSTLLKTITGNLSPLDGDVYLNGEPLADLSVKEKAQRLAVLLTDKAHLGFTTVREMITLGRNPYTNWMNTLRPNDSQAIDRALSAIGMSELVDKPLAELSDGNLQKVIIGRAIAQETEIIILDEPTIHLDITNKTIIIELLRRLCQEHGKTILLSTHDLELARHYADELWIMEEDQLIQGLTEDIILQGIIEKSFKYEVAPFNSPPENILVNGPAHIQETVSRALAKAGISSDIEMTINVKAESNSYVFIADNEEFDRLATLLDYLAASIRTR